MTTTETATLNNTGTSAVNIEQLMTDLGNRHGAYLARPVFQMVRDLAQAFAAASAEIATADAADCAEPPIDYLIEQAVAHVNVAVRRFQRSENDADRLLLVAALRNASASLSGWTATRGQLLGSMKGGDR